MLVSIQDYKCRKMEHKYFNFYCHVEDYFPEKTSERDIALRMYLAIRYLQDLTLTLYKMQDVSPSIKKIAKAEAGWLKEIAEVLDA